MARSIVGRNLPDYQLVVIGIELVHKVFGLLDCNPELANNPHVVKANECAKRWNELFFDCVSLQKSLGIKEEV